MASSWELVDPLEELRAEFNTLSPKRDKASDGSIGDAAHQDRSSNHNPDDTAGVATPQTDSDSKPEVRAIDVDKSGPWPSPMTFDLACEELRKRHKDGRDDRLIEIIWNRRKATRSNGWVWQDYTGSNAHTEHAHFGLRADRDTKTGPWGLVAKWGDELPMDQSSFNNLMNNWAKTDDGKRALENAAYADAVQRVGEDGQPVPASDPNQNQSVHSALRYLARDTAWIMGDLKDLRAKVENLTPPPAGSSATKTATAKAGSTPKTAGR